MPAFAFSKRAVETCTANQEVLAGNVAGVRRTQERAGGAELIRVAEAFGWNGGDAVGSNLVQRSCSSVRQSCSRFRVDGPYRKRRAIYC